MNRCTLIVALFCSSLVSVETQAGRFPYDAVISQDETYVRSGPGTRYYPTARLRQGTKVTVYRHDPGGWYMIAPPAGSFSWIRANYVDLQPDGTGTVNENRVVVRVGTVFGDTRDVEQKRLSTGDRVQILGEQSFASAGSEIRMYKIAPPRGEYRWVPGQFVVSPESFAQQQNPSGLSDRSIAVKKSQSKPKVDPMTESHPVEQQMIETRPVTVQSGNGNRNDPVRPDEGVVRTKTPEETLADKQARERLSKLDAEFGRMVRLEIKDWKFSELEKEYLELQQNATSETFLFQLDQRFAALAKYQKLKDQYDDFIHLTSETSRRDAELLRSSRRVPAAVGQPQSTSGNSGIPAPVRAIPKRTVPPAEPGNSQSSVPGLVQGEEDAAAFSKPKVKLSGAGVISRAVVDFPGAPKHLLLSPDGRMLAYLIPLGGLDLDRYAGHPVGVTGKRSRRADLQADVIEVESITPVKLKSPAPAPQ